MLNWLIGLTTLLHDQKSTIAMPFEKIQTKKKSTYAAEQILNAIRQGNYSIEDRLPPERDIAQQMGVSRSSVREALSALQVVGIVESRAGAGTYIIRKPTTTREGEEALYLLEESESLQEIYEARRVLEESVVRLACIKATSQDIEKIGRLADEMNDVQTLDEFNRINRSFHMALVKATHNSLLVRSIRQLLKAMEQQISQKLRELFYADKKDFNEACDIHRQIYQAIKQRDPVSATREISRHFDMLEKERRDSN